VRTAGFAVVGLDFGALLDLGRAAGACPLTLAEMLPEVEDVIVHEMNAQIREMSNG
jgi:ribosomal protein RSM22 (predicted rRNA methylase)